MANFQIRTMTRKEVAFAVSLAAKEGWNPGLHDPQAFYDTDPDGFLVGLLDGKPIGCISAVSYAGIFGFIGLYIVLPEFRGQGYGIQLWHAAVKRLQGHNIGLDGVVERQPQYRQSGFKLAYRNIRYQGQAAPDNNHLPELTDLKALSFDQLAGYDNQFFPADRKQFLQAWLTMPNGSGLAYIEGNTIKGYSLIRECGIGYKIGPLFADTPDIAESLFSALSAKASAGAPVFLDIPEPNAEAIALVNRHNMQKVFETARMYTGTEPAISLDRTYGITTFELG